MTHQKVIDRLVALGLTTYEAKVFSALTRLGEAGVAEIHAVAEVPRSAVYGTLEKLELKGIIETSTGRPKRFRALPPKVAVTKIESSLSNAAKDAREGLEELASSPHRDVSDVRIWAIRGRTRVREKLEEICAAAKSEMLVAGTAEHMLMFADVWKNAISRKVKAQFASPEPDKIAKLSSFGEILRPKFDMGKHKLDPPRVLFVRVDRRTILLASDYSNANRMEGMTAFWTDDDAIVKFLNYLTDALSPPDGKGKRSH